MLWQSNRSYTLQALLQPLESAGSNAAVHALCENKSRGAHAGGEACRQQRRGPGSRGCCCTAAAARSRFRLRHCYCCCCCWIRLQAKTPLSDATEQAKAWCIAQGIASAVRKFAPQQSQEERALPPPPLLLLLLLLDPPASENAAQQRYRAGGNHDALHRGCQDSAILPYMPPEQEYSSARVCRGGWVFIILLSRRGCQYSESWPTAMIGQNDGERVIAEPGTLLGRDLCFGQTGAHLHLRCYYYCYYQILQSRRRLHYYYYCCCWMILQARPTAQQ